MNLHNRKDSFLLSKWYVDLVDETGNLFIIYIGQICFRKVSIYYSSVLKRFSGSTPEEIYSIKKYNPPVVEPDTFSWTSKPLSLELKFHQRGISVSKELINSDLGYIQWNCLHSKSLGEVIINGERYSGYGYVERVDMTIKPWMLPFHELRWGRFISGEDFVIWVDYKGDLNNSFIIFNNDEYTDIEFPGDKVIFNKGNNVLLLSNPSDIKKGEIISSTFSKIPVIKKIIPSTLFRIHEHKSCSKAVLLGNQNISGWAIFEVVKWL